MYQRRFEMIINTKQTDRPLITNEVCVTNEELEMYSEGPEAYKKFVEEAVLGELGMYFFSMLARNDLWKIYIDTKWIDLEGMVPGLSDLLRKRNGVKMIFKAELYATKIFDRRGPEDES